MNFYLLLLAEFLTLFFLSRIVTRTLSILLYAFRFNQTISILCISLLFIPGTIIHELSHYFMAKLLMVPTGEISLIPKLEGTTLRMGSVQVAKVDKIRQLLIGLAPVVTGILFIIITLAVLLPRITTINYFIIGLFIYLLFVITNSMFSSKKDVEGAGVLVIFLFLVVLTIFIVNRQQFMQTMDSILAFIPLIYLHTAVMYLALPIILDIIIIFVLRLLIHLLNK